MYNVAIAPLWGQAQGSFRLNVLNIVLRRQAVHSLQWVEALFVVGVGTIYHDFALARVYLVAHRVLNKDLVVGHLQVEFVARNRHLATATRTVRKCNSKGQRVVIQRGVATTYALHNLHSALIGIARQHRRKGDRYCN